MNKTVSEDVRAWSRTENPILRCFFTTLGGSPSLFAAELSDTRAIRVESMVIGVIIRPGVWTMALVEFGSMTMLLNPLVEFGSMGIGQTLLLGSVRSYVLPSTARMAQRGCPASYHKSRHQPIVARRFLN